MKGLSVQILIVDDDYQDTQLIWKMLYRKKPAHWCLSNTECLEEALYSCDGEGVNLILLDLSLPDVDPLESIAKIRAVAPKTPIIAMISAETEHLLSRVLIAGVSDYFSKDDIGSNSLIQVIENTLIRSRIPSNTTLDDRGYRKFLQQSDRCLALLDPRGIIIETNRNFLNFWRITERESLGSPIWSVLPSIPEEEIKIWFQDILASGNLEKAFQGRLFDGDNIYLKFILDYRNQPLFSIFEYRYNREVYDRENTDTKKIKFKTDNNNLENFANRIKNFTLKIERAKHNNILDDRDFTTIKPIELIFDDRQVS